MSPRRKRGISSVLAVSVVLVAAVAFLSLGAAPGEAQKSTSKKTGKGSSAAKADPGQEVLARVGSSVITRADFEARLAEIPPQFKSQFATPEQKMDFLNRMIEERVWLESSVSAGVDKRPEIERQLTNQRRDLLIRTYLGEEMGKAPAPSDSMIQAYYAAHPDEFMAEEQVKVRHIQTPDEKTAKKALKDLEKGQDFAAVATKYSTDAVTKDKGGDLGTVTKTGFFGSLGRQQALADTAFAAPIDKVIGPIQTGLGWHLIETTERIPAKPRPLDEVRPLITRQLTQTANQEYYTQILSSARSKLSVSVDSAAVDSVVNAKKTAVEMFREAGETPNPDDRIRAYQRVAQTYPESEYAPQSLFMVGFVESEEKRDYDKAEQAFRELLARYPKSELATSAQWMLDNMRSDKTPDFDLPGGMGDASAHDDAKNQPKTPEAGGKP